MKVSDLKVGDRLFVGRYKCSSADYEAPPISWLKASRGNEFLSEFVLDYIPYDAAERGNPDYTARYCGLSDYELSNIRQFLNSSEVDWYVQSHDYDRAPALNEVNTRSIYGNLPGFLSGFEPHEISCLTSGIELPSGIDIIGGRRFELFNRRGIRPKVTEDLYMHRDNHSFTETSFVPFMLCDAHNEYYIRHIDRMGSLQTCPASTVCGVRPKTSFNPDAEVVKLEDGSGYCLAGSNNFPRKEARVCEWSDIEELLGLL